MGQSTLLRRAAAPRDAPARDVSGADAAAEPAPRPEFVQGVERCFAVIRAFGDDTPTLTITGVSERTGLTRAVARRYLLTLLDLGYLVQRGTQFSMTPRILDIGFTYLMSVDVARVAQPYLETLVETLHESSSAAVLDGADIVYVVRVPARRIMSANLVIGSRLPAHATSIPGVGGAARQAGRRGVAPHSPDVEPSGRAAVTGAPGVSGSGAGRCGSCKAACVTTAAASESE